MNAFCKGFWSDERRDVRRGVVALAGALLATSSLATPAHAAVVPTYSEDDTSEEAYTVSSKDLVENGSSTLSSATSPDFQSFTDGSGPSNIAALGNGTLGTPGTEFADETAVDTGGDWTLTYALNTTAAPTGYTINEIDAYSGWTKDFVNQHFSVSYSTAADPTTFISLGTFENDTTAGAGENPQISLKTALTDSSGGAIADNLADLEFTFLGDSVDDHHAGYREIDVIGTPEPASLSLIAVASTALLTRRRRA